MENVAGHEFQAVHVNVKSFNIIKGIIDSNFFSKVELSPTARLVMFSLANMYNPKKGYVYPKNNKLTKCTGAGERAVSQSISELREKGFIFVVMADNFRQIYFTRKTYGLLGIIESGEAPEGVADNSEGLGKNFCPEVEKIAVGVAENRGGGWQKMRPHVMNK